MKVTSEIEQVGGNRDARVTSLWWFYLCIVPFCLTSHNLDPANYLHENPLVFVPAINNVYLNNVDNVNRNSY